MIFKFSEIFRKFLAWIFLKNTFSDSPSIVDLFLYFIYSLKLSYPLWIFSMCIFHSNSLITPYVFYILQIYLYSKFEYHGLN